jgi:hypothetical protein
MDILLILSVPIIVLFLLNACISYFVTGTIYPVWFGRMLGRKYVILKGDIACAKLMVNKDPLGEEYVQYGYSHFYLKNSGTSWWRILELPK